MGSGPIVGVVTVTYNSAGVLPDFLRSALAQKFDRFNLYVVDNASLDSSVNIVECVSDERIRLIRNSENLGVAEGNNQGIAAAIADGCSRVILLNNDTEFSPDLFGLLNEQADEHAIVVPKIYFHDKPELLWFAGGHFNSCRGYSTTHLGEGQFDRGQYDIPRYVTYAPTCCMMVDADVFRRIGAMDARYFVYYDDTDFCLRVMRGGERIWYTPAAHLAHKVGSLTGGRVSVFGARMGVRNKVYFLRKNFSAIQAYFFLVAYFGYLALRWAAGQDSWAYYKLKLEAFLEGFSVHKRPPLRL